MSETNTFHAIEELLGIDPLPTLDPAASARDRFLLKTIKRLKIAHEFFKDNASHKGDFLLALRDFLITFGVDVQIDLDIAEGNPFGLAKDPVSGRIFASAALPNHLSNPDFVQTVFLKDAPQPHNEPNLLTDPMINALTGYKKFKSLGQKLAVYGALNTPDGYSTLISLPTGAGKSLITQTLAYQHEGLTVVVVPTVSLAIDQVRTSRATIKKPSVDKEVFYYASGVDIAPILWAIERRTAHLLFISPEALIGNERFIDAIENASRAKYLKNLVIDEAHAVVDWGDSFRVEFQCLAPWRRSIIGLNSELRTFLLSATFEESCVNTLRELFSTGGRWLEIRCDALRKEPRYILVRSATKAEKHRKLLELAVKLPHPMIIYVAYPAEADVIRKMLKDVAGVKNTRAFTGKTGAAERRDLIDEWADDKFSIMVATSAFGVGVDKGDVRTVLHTYVPQNPNTYYQELGRGGRDGLPCLSVMCIDKDDPNAPFQRISKRIMTPEKLVGRWDCMYMSTSSNRSGNKVYLDTSVRPSYNIEDTVEDQDASEADINWNEYVLLLFRRHGLISIDEIIKAKNGSFIFAAEVCEPALMDEPGSQRKLEVVTRAREAEWNRKMGGYKDIKKALSEAGNTCWSEMFFETYPLVSECCPGCPEHDRPRGCRNSEYPLRRKVNAPVRVLAADQERSFGDSPEALFLFEGSPSKAIETLMRFRPSIITSDDPAILADSLEINQPSANFMVMSLDELTALARNGNDFYVSGIALAVYSNEATAPKTLDTVWRHLPSHHDLKVIHVTRKNYYIEQLGKTLSDVINGPVISSRCI